MVGVIVADDIVFEIGNLEVVRQLSSKGFRSLPQLKKTISAIMRNVVRITSPPSVYQIVGGQSSNPPNFLRQSRPS